jgi:hypothetical protein
MVLSIAYVVLFALVACSPTRQSVRVDDSTLMALLPCRPERRVRNVVVAAATVRMEMVACTADGVTFAASHFAAQDPGAVTRGLEELKTAAVVNLAGTVIRQTPFRLEGMTPNPAAVRLVIAGRLPGGETAEMHSVFFARGLRVYQVSVLGSKPPADAVETFLAGIGFRG